MIEIQLEIDGPWIPLVRALSSMDLGIERSRKILNAGLWGIRILYPGSDAYAFRAWRHSLTGETFAWQSGSMAAPAFARLDGND